MFLQVLTRDICFHLDLGLNHLCNFLSNFVTYEKYQVSERFEENFNFLFLPKLAEKTQLYKLGAVKKSSIMWNPYLWAYVRINLPNALAIG